MEGLFQPVHLIIILVIALVIFGPGKLPDLGSGLGKSIREFKKAMSDNNDIDVTPDQKKKPEEIAPSAAPEMKTETASKDRVDAGKEKTA